MSRARFIAAIVLLVGVGVLWMAWPLPLELGTAWTSARAEGDLAWSLLLHRWATEALAGEASWTSDPRVWSPDGGALATSAWNLVALLGTAWLGWGTSALEAWHRTMLFIGLCNGLGGAWLGFRVGGRTGAVVGAVGCACAPLAWFELAEGRLEQGLIAPLAVWIAEAWALSRSPRPLLAGAALGLVAATYWFLGPIVLVVGLALPLVGPDRVRPRPDRWWLAGLVLCGGIVALALSPVAGAAWAGAQNAAVVDPVLGHTQRLASAVSPLAWVTGGPLPAHRVPLVALLWVPLVFRKAELRPWLVALVPAVVLAAGPVLAVDGQPVLVGGFELSLPLRWLDVLPGFRRFWWPDRILAVAGVVAVAGLAHAVSLLPRRWSVAGVAAVLLAVDGRVQLHHAIASGDPRIPQTPLDPPSTGAFFAVPTVPALESHGPAIIGPWRTTANTIPLVHIQSGRPLLRGDGAADARLWPASFATRVDQSPVLTALWTASDPSALRPEDLDGLGVDAVFWLGPDGRDGWTHLLGCAPHEVGLWATWDRTREDCR